MKQIRQSNISNRIRQRIKQVLSEITGHAPTKHVNQKTFRTIPTKERLNYLAKIHLLEFKYNK